MNFFFEKNYKIKNTNFFCNNLYRVYYYDQYKYIHFFEGQCINIKRVFNDFLVSFKIKNKDIKISFFLSSPFLISFSKI
jgi:hypothetical protein